MAKTTEEERKRRDERKLSSGTPPRKLSTENAEQVGSEGRGKSAAERKRSPTSKKSVGNGPLDSSVVRKTSTGCNVAERKISKEHVANGPMIVGK